MVASPRGSQRVRVGQEPAPLHLDLMVRNHRSREVLIRTFVRGRCSPRLSDPTKTDSALQGRAAGCNQMPTFQTLRRSVYRVHAEIGRVNCPTKPLHPPHNFISKPCLSVGLFLFHPRPAGTPALRAPVWLF